LEENRRKFCRGLQWVIVEMKNLTWFLHAIDYINEWCGRIVSFLPILLTGVVAFDVVARYFFNRPTIWAMEVSQMTMLIMICLGVGAVLLHDGHVKVSIIYDIISIKKRAMLDLAIYPLVMIVSFVLVWYGSKIFWQNLIYGFRTCSLWAPVQWPTKMMVPISGSLLGLQCLSKLIRSWIIVWSGVKVESEILSKHHEIRLGDK
jgi:TRAP-type mannitol/chloroaromatic compound transport system permease small subunit